MEKHWELKKLKCEGVKCLEHNVLFLRLKNLIALRLQWILYCVFWWDSTWALSDNCWWACWSHQDSVSLTPDMNDKSPLTDRKNLLKPKPQAATRKKNSTENAPESKILQGINLFVLAIFQLQHLYSDTCRFESITRFNPHGNPITLEEAIVGLIQKFSHLIDLFQRISKLSVGDHQRVAYQKVGSRGSSSMSQRRQQLMDSSMRREHQNHFLWHCKAFISTNHYFLIDPREKCQLNTI